MTTTWASNPLWCPIGHFNEVEADKLYEIVAARKPRFCIETGFCTGRSTCAALTAARDTIVKFYTIDIDFRYRPEGPAYRQKFTDAYPGVFKSIEASSRRVFTPEFFATEFPEGVDYATVDGDHSHAGCLFDLEALWPHMTPGGVIFVDDYKSGPPQGSYIPEVICACDDFSSAHPEARVDAWRSPCGKGACIFTKPEL